MDKNTQLIFYNRKETHAVTDLGVSELLLQLEVKFM